MATRSRSVQEDADYFDETDKMLDSTWKEEGSTKKANTLWGYFRFGYYRFSWIWPAPIILSIVFMMFSVSRAGGEHNINMWMAYLMYLPMMGTIIGAIWVHSICRTLFDLKSMSALNALVGTFVFPVLIWLIRNVGKSEDLATGLTQPPKTYQTLAFGFLLILPVFWVFAFINAVIYKMHKSFLTSLQLTARAMVSYGFLLAVIPFSAWFGQDFFGGQKRGSFNEEYGTHNVDPFIPNKYLRSISALLYVVAVAVSKGVIVALLPRGNTKETLKPILVQFLSLTIAAIPYRLLVNTMDTWLELILILCVEFGYKTFVIFILVTPLGKFADFLSSGFKSKNADGGYLREATALDHVSDDAKPMIDTEEDSIFEEEENADEKAMKTISVQLFLQHVADGTSPINFMFIFLIVLGGYVGKMAYWGFQAPWGDPHPYVGPPLPGMDCADIDETIIYPHYTSPNVGIKFKFLAVCFGCEILYISLVPLGIMAVGYFGRKMSESLFNRAFYFRPMQYGPRVLLKFAFHGILVFTLMFNVLLFATQAPFWHDIPQYKADNKEHIMGRCKSNIENGKFEVLCFNQCRVAAECRLDNQLCAMAQDKCFNSSDPLGNGLCTGIMSRCLNLGLNESLCDNVFLRCDKSLNEGKKVPLCGTIQDKCLNVTGENAELPNLCQGIKNACLNNGTSDKLCAGVLEKCVADAGKAKEPLPTLCMDVMGSCLADPTQTLCTNISTTCFAAGFTNPLCNKVFDKCVEAAGKGPLPPLCKNIQGKCLADGTGPTLCKNISHTCQEDGLSNPLCKDIYDTCKTDTDHTLCKEILGGCIAGSESKLCQDVLGQCKIDGLKNNICKAVFSNCTASAEKGDLPKLCLNIMGFCENNGTKTYPLCADIEANCLKDGFSNHLCEDVFQNCSKAIGEKKELPLCKEVLGTCLSTGIKTHTLCSDIQHQCLDNGLEIPVCDKVYNTCNLDANQGNPQPLLCNETLTTCLADGNSRPFCAEVMQNCSKNGFADKMCFGVFMHCEAEAEKDDLGKLCQETMSNCLSKGLGVEICSDIVHYCNDSLKEGKKPAICSDVIGKCLGLPGATLCSELLTTCEGAIKNGEKVPICNALVETCASKVSSTTEPAPPSCVSLCAGLKKEGVSQIPMCAELCKNDPNQCPK